VDVEHTHENRNACHRACRKAFDPAAIVDPQFLGRLDLGDQGHEPVRRRYDGYIVLRNNALGIAEEGEDAACESQQGPPDPIPVQQQQEYQADAHGNQSELAPFRMDRGQGPAGIAPPVIV
jgi:hypothetical protein